MPRRAQGKRVLITAPYGRDAESAASILEDGGYETHICPTLTDMAKALDDDVGAALLTEEALATDLLPLQQALEAQPGWSDVPFVLLAARQTDRQRQPESARLRLPELATNVMVMERPLGSVSLMSAIAAALRSRQKQFEIRDRMVELADERARFKTLLENLPVGVNFMDPEGRSVLSNPSFERFLPKGVSPSKLLEEEDQWIAFDAAGQRMPRSRFPDALALRGEIAKSLELRHRSEDGREVWARVSGVPLHDSAGKIIGALSVIVDNDEQKRAQETLQRFNESLEAEVSARTEDLENALEGLRLESAERERAESALRQSQKMEAVGQLTGGIAHDFNNMLTGIIGSIDIMKRRISAGNVDGLDRFMNAASVSAHRAAGLTQRLLAFSRRQSLDSKPIDVNALVGSLHDLLQRAISERVSLVISLADNLPAGIADANQLESAILNLAINARDAMPDGGKLTVETNVVELDTAYAVVTPDIKPGRYIVIAVSDTGVGIAPELIDKVFEPFFTTKPIGQGTGLGLSMVYGFARQSNGQVRIHSLAGQGTSVKIYLPAAVAAEEIASPALHDLAPQGIGQSVLVVEDDESVRLLVREVLEELGYIALEAPEPQSAIAILESTRAIDLMISDVGLPGMNGRQLAEIARQHRASLPILFITGYAENAAIRSGFLGTNMAMITKPFALDTLAAKIGDMLAPEETNFAH